MRAAPARDASGSGCGCCSGPRAPVRAPARPCALNLAAPLLPATMGARPRPLLSTLLLPLLAGESPENQGYRARL